MGSKETIPFLISGAVLPILISGAALAVSLISLYFSVWYKKISLVGCLAAWNSQDSDDELSVICEITLSNTGNQELLLREIYIELDEWKTNELVPSIVNRDIPQVIKPGTVVLLKLPIPKLFLNELAKDNRKMKLDFHFFTPKANLQIAQKTLTPFSDSEIPDEDWRPFKLK